MDRKIVRLPSGRLVYEHKRWMPTETADMYAELKKLVELQQTVNAERARLDERFIQVAFQEAARSSSQSSRGPLSLLWLAVWSVLKVGLSLLLSVLLAAVVFGLFMAGSIPPVGSTLAAIGGFLVALSLSLKWSFKTKEALA